MYIEIVVVYNVNMKNIYIYIYIHIDNQKTHTVIIYIWLVIQRIGIWETCDSTIPILPRVLPIHFVTKDIGYINPICPDHALFLSSWKRALGLFGF